MLASSANGVPAMQNSRLALAAVVACLLSLLAEPASANIKCPPDLGGIPLIPGRPGEAQPGQAVEIPGFEGTYTANCGYKGDFEEEPGVEKHVEMRVTAKWHPMQGGDLFGCAKLSGRPAEWESDDKTRFTLLAEDRQASVDVVSTHPLWGETAKALGVTIMEAVAGMAGTCRQ
jgi:hypothetical protein